MRDGEEQKSLSGYEARSVLGEAGERVVDSLTDLL